MNVFEMPRIREEDDGVLVGSYKQGEMFAVYEKLIELFGEPNRGDGDKTTVEWVIQTPDGLATIYDYKEELLAGDITRWHIGGFRPEVVAHITIYYNDNTL